MPKWSVFCDFVNLAIDICDIWIGLHVVMKSHGNWVGKHQTPKLYTCRHNTIRAWHLTSPTLPLHLPTQTKFKWLEIQACTRIVYKLSYAWKKLGQISFFLDDAREWKSLVGHGSHWMFCMFCTNFLLVGHILEFITLYRNIFLASYTPTLHTCTLKQVWGTCALRIFCHAFYFFFFFTPKV